MSSFGTELLAELVPTLVYSLAALALTAGGLLAEYSSLRHAGGGELEVALWFAALGAIMLYAGLYGVGYRKLLSGSD